MMTTGKWSRYRQGRSMLEAKGSDGAVVVGSILNPHVSSDHPDRMQRKASGRFREWFTWEAWSGEVISRNPLTFSNEARGQRDSLEEARKAAEEALQSMQAEVSNVR